MANVPAPPPPPNWAGQQKPAPAETLGAPAGFWIRFVAYLIDAFILGVVFILVCGVMALVAAILGLFDDNSGEDLSPAAIGIIVLGLLVQIFVNWLYEALLTSGTHGATLGKRAVGVRIVREDGSTMGFGRATLRFFLKVMVTPMLPFAIGYLLAAFTSRKRALHDLMADTYVIKSS